MNKPCQISVTLSFWYSSAMSLRYGAIEILIIYILFHFIGIFSFIYFVTSLILKANFMKQKAHKPLLLMKAFSQMFYNQIIL